MKARAVEGLEPEMQLGDAMRRIVAVRAAELHSFVPQALDPVEDEALHDMRIAAKRLRYVLELAEPCFGEAARAGAKRARALQDVIGDIHDCDVLLPLVRDEPELGAAVLRRRHGLFTRFLDMWGSMEEEQWTLPA